MSTYFDEVDLCIKSLEKQHRDAAKICGYFDAAEQDILHYIEFEKLSASAGSKLLKKLKEIRRDRRAAKNTLGELQSILTRLKNAGVQNRPTLEKTYSCKVLPLEDILSGQDIVPETVSAA